MLWIKSIRGTVINAVGRSSQSDESPISSELMVDEGLMNGTHSQDPLITTAILTSYDVALGTSQDMTLH